MTHSSALSVPLETAEQEILLRLIRETLSWSELPLYEHEYQALKTVLEKLDQGGRTA